MSASIDDVLAFRAPNGAPTSILPPRLAMLVLDTLEAPADFLIVHLLSRAFKQGRNCCLVACSKDKDYYNAVLKKHVCVTTASWDLCCRAHAAPSFSFFQGVQLQTHLKAGTCKFVDAANMVSSYEATQSPADTLEHIRQQVQSSIDDFQADVKEPRSATPPPLIIVDGFASLLWAADASPSQLSSLYRSLRSLASESSATLLSTFHADDCFSHLSENSQTPDASTDVALKALIRLSHLWLTTRSLRPQLMGEVRLVLPSFLLSKMLMLINPLSFRFPLQLTIHRGPALGAEHPSVASMPRHRPVQYKIEENGPVVWSKGMGAGFL